MDAGALTAERLDPWIEFQFERSGGPGGQNVNKVNTRATLLLNFRACPLFTPEQRDRIERQLASRLAHDGRLRVVAQQARTQADNRRLAQARMIELLAAALHRARPRRPTRPTAGSRARRLAAKKARGELKRRRGERLE